MTRIGVMMHSILSDMEWDYSFLSITFEELQCLIKFSKKLGFKFVKSSDWAGSDGNAICLTFDDGYLDNWTMLFPYLEKQSIPFTIFINKDFVIKDGVPRKLGLRKPGYLNISEIQTMYNSGFVDIQSHSATHTWYPTSDEIVDFYSIDKKCKYPWLQWNVDPVRKPFWLEETFNYIDGFPVFKNDRSLRAKRFLFDDDKIVHFTKYIANKRPSIQEANNTIRIEYGALGKFENDEETKHRYELEIVDNIEFIQDILDYTSNVLCWPGGAYNEMSQEVAKSYELITTTNRGYGNFDSCLHRISPVNPYGRYRFPWKYQNLTLIYYFMRYKFNALINSN